MNSCFAFILLTCVTLACGSKALEYEANQVTAGGSEIEEKVFSNRKVKEAMFQPAESCIRSGGMWNQVLMSCACPDEKLFFVDRGCDNFHLESELGGEIHICESDQYEVFRVVPGDFFDEQRSCDVDGVEFGLHCADFSTDQKRFISEKKNLVSSVLKHFSYAEYLLPYTIRLKLREDIGSAFQTLTSPSYGKFSWLHADMLSLLSDEESSRKRKMFLESLDSDINALIKRIQTGEENPYSSFFETSPGCEFGCHINSFFDSSPGEFQAFLTTVMLKKIPTDRLLEIYRKDGDKWMFRLSAVGDIVQAEREWFESSTKIPGAGTLHYHKYSGLGKVRSSRSSAFEHDFRQKASFVADEKYF